MAQVGLERADGQGLTTTGGHLGQGADLDGVADAGTGGVAFQQRDLRRRKFRGCVGGTQGSHLSLLRGNQQAASAAVVGQPDTANHAQDVISVTAGIFHASQSHQGRAFGWHQAISLGMEGPAASGRAECAQGGEALMDEKIVGAIHRPSQHQIGVTVVQEIAGQLDGVDRGGAGGVQREGDATQSQSLGEKVRGQARHEAIARIHRWQRQVIEGLPVQQLL